MSKMVKAGYAERVVRTYGIWDCNPVLTPLDPNIRLTKQDSPEVVDPRLWEVSHMWFTWRYLICLHILRSWGRPSQQADGLGR